MCSVLTRNNGSYVYLDYQVVTKDGKNYELGIIHQIHKGEKEPLSYLLTYNSRIQCTHKSGWG